MKVAEGDKKFGKMWEIEKRGLFGGHTSKGSFFVRKFNAAQKKCQITILSRKFELSTHSTKQLTYLFKFSAQGSDLAPFIGNGTKVKIFSEIKPPLTNLFFSLSWAWNSKIVNYSNCDRARPLPCHRMI